MPSLSDYLMYRKAESGTDFIGGVDLVGEGTIVELQWIDNVQVLRITGYDADTHDDRAPKKLRTLILKAKSAAVTPTLVEWQHALSWAHVSFLFIYRYIYANLAHSLTRSP